MKRHIFRSICMVAFVAVISLFILITGRLYAYFTGVQFQQLKVQTELASKAVNDEGMDYFKHLSKSVDYRITWIDKNGDVLFDNQELASKMENHSQREEFKEAKKHGVGQSDRYSNTLMRRSLYCAQQLNDGSVLRLSSDQNSVLSLALNMLQPIAGMVLLVILFSLYFANRVSQRIVQPLNEMDLDHPLSKDHYEELSPLLHRIDLQQRQLKEQEDALRHKQYEFDTVTSNMNEGLALLNPEGIILFLNRKAKLLLGANDESVGKDILMVNRSLKVHDLLTQAQAGKKEECLLDVNGETYQMLASPIMGSHNVRGIALLILNVTEKIQAEALRREFTGNVSHELKSPLHTISGCAELLMNHMVKPGDEPRFVSQIYNEAQRMIALVEDIIKLSHLDEGAQDMAYEDVEVLPFCQSIVDRLQAKADKSKVTLSLQGDATSLHVIPQLFESIIYNLCDNGIKYNKENGKVDITVKDELDFVTISIQDTGIGIPREDHQRIFERFYRVDKSHSKEVGGTGLGLSIVKHAVQVLHAQLSVDSIPNKGTTMQIRFLKNQ